MPASASANSAQPRWFLFWNWTRARPTAYRSAALAAPSTGAVQRIAGAWQNAYLIHLVDHGGDGDFILLLLQSRLGWMWLCRHRRWP
jgi:hypothetical protein